MELIKIIILSVLIIFVLAAIIVLNIMMRHDKTDYSLLYYNLFQQWYSESKDVKYTLTMIRDHFSQDLNPKRKELAILNAALGYLENSIMKDYKTAFSMIETVFRSKEIAEMHQVCMRDVAARRQYLITSSN